MATGSVALVTGASSGFGQLTARLLVEHGFQVFGTSRKLTPGASGVDMLELDVTSTESVNACIQRVLMQCQRIDLLVNNAGQTYASLIEETPWEEARKIFETNFWGVVRVTNAVLPTMRQQRTGLIVNVGSLAGLTGTPGMGFYAASKHALEGYAESLRLEVERFNIGISLVEPGFFRTNLHHAMSRDAHRIPDYDGLGTTIQSVVNDATWVPRMKAALPESWFLAALRRRFGLGRRTNDQTSK